MGLSYYRRFRMEIDFQQVVLPEPSLPEGYSCVPWNRNLADRHASVKFESFKTEIDSKVFRCLSELQGCQRLMNDITTQKHFLPETTWLVSFCNSENHEYQDCATIQGVRQTSVMGAIQNVGVIPTHRGMGLGRAIVLLSLQGFRQVGMRRVYLEVTAQNKAAVSLYRSLGFRLTRTMYKASDFD